MLSFFVLWNFIEFSNIRIVIVSKLRLEMNFRKGVYCITRNERKWTNSLLAALFDLDPGKSDSKAVSSEGAFKMDKDHRLNFNRSHWENGFRKVSLHFVPWCLYATTSVTERLLLVLENKKRSRRVNRPMNGNSQFYFTNNILTSF